MEGPIDSTADREQNTRPVCLTKQAGLFFKRKRIGMRKSAASICFFFALLGFAASPAPAQDDEAARANALFTAGKRPDALPLYEHLAKAHPNEMLYAERLADCLGAMAAQLSDPAELKAVRTRQRDAAKRAVELGETAEYIRMMAAIDPSQPLYAGIVSPAKALLAEAEKAYTAGDFLTAMAKYTAAAEAARALRSASLCWRHRLRGTRPRYRRRMSLRGRLPWTPTARPLTGTGAMQF